MSRSITSSKLRTEVTSDGGSIFPSRIRFDIRISTSLFHWTHLNVEIPTGGTVEEIQFALVVDGVIDPASVMLTTPSAVEVASNIGTAIIASVPSVCGCDSIALVNIGTQPINVVNGALKFDYEGVRRIR